MSDNLPQKYKSNFFQNIIKKIKNVFFYKGKNIEQTMNSIETKQNKKEKVSSFTEQIKIGDDNKNIDYEKKKFMQNLTENQELLKEFSNDRLEKILQHYIEENKKKREILKRLNS